MLPLLHSFVTIRLCTQVFFKAFVLQLFFCVVDRRAILLQICALVTNKCVNFRLCNQTVRRKRFLTCIANKMDQRKRENKNFLIWIDKLIVISQKFE